MVVDAASDGLDEDGGSVETKHFFLKERAVVAFEGLTEMFLDEVAEIGVDEFEERFADEFHRGSGTEERHRGWVRKHDGVVAADEHGVGGGFDEAAVTLFTFAQGLLGLSAFSFLRNFLERAVDSWAEASEAIFQEVIVGTGVERFDGDILTDLA